MTIGYLHVGQARHGVTRYGRILAEAARRHDELKVIEAHAPLSGTPFRNRRALRRACRQLEDAQIVHLQYTADVWGGPYDALANLATFDAYCGVPWVVTIHDVPQGYRFIHHLRELWRQRRKRPQRPSHSDGGGAVAPISTLRSVARSAVKAGRFLRDEWRDAVSTRWLVDRAGHVLVCSHDEARRLRTVGAALRLSVIPHFVERRNRPGSRGDMKASVGHSGKFVLTVLGFIHRRKGHDLVVEALAYLPGSMHVVFAGGTRHEAYLQQLRQRAEEIGVSDQLEITGYLEEARLDEYLYATDVALCPYRWASASGSLSTWLSVGCPVLASDLPLIREYNAMAPGAIQTFPALTPAAVAQAITRVKDEGRVPAPLAHLQEKLRPEKVIGRHVAVYQKVLSSSP